MFDITNFLPTSGILALDVIFNFYFVTIIFLFVLELFYLPISMIKKK